MKGSSERSVGEGSEDCPPVSESNKVLQAKKNSYKY